MSRAIPGARCWRCNKEFVEGDYWCIIYHFDQDDRVCEDCAKKMEHTDTLLRGMNVWETNQMWP